MSGADHGAYPDTLFFKTSNETLAWIALGLILILEFATGLLLIKGAFDMWQARLTSDFEQAKKWSQIGAAFGVLVWFGFFGVIGAAFFHMWQTQVGTGSMNGAFQFFVACSITLIVISMSDDKT